MPKLGIRTADQLVEHMKQAKLTKLQKLDQSPYLATTLMAIKGHEPTSPLDYELRNDQTPPHITKGIEKTAQKARFK